MTFDEMKHELVHLGNGAHALAYQILGNPDDAADAVQDALVTALSKPRSYNAKKGPLKPWFLRVVRNRCIDLIRQRKRSEPDVETLADTGARSPEESAIGQERDDALVTALLSLSADHREVIVLRDYLGLSYQDVATTLDIAIGTVMSRIHRARLALREALDAR